MRQTFLLVIVGICGTALFGYGLWLVIQSIIGMVKDWRLSKELDELEALGRERRKAKDSG